MSSIYIHKSINCSLRNALLRFFDSVSEIDIEDPSSFDLSSIVILDYSYLETAPDGKVAEILERGIHPFIAAEKMKPEIPALMKQLGIARFSDYGSMIQNAQLLFCEKDSVKTGTIILIDENEITGRMLGSIADLFGYSLERVSNLEACISRIAFSPDIVLHNLAFGGIDRYQFTKRMSYSNLTQIPYIAFKSDGARIALEDIQCGIQRFTRMILSLEETYSVLAMNLFRREFFGRMAKANEIAEFSDNAISGIESLKKIFFAHQDLFYSENSLPLVERIIDENGKFLLPAKSLAKMSCLRWLIKGKDISKDLDAR
jgi:CheY-like chemotaxis protein